VLSRELFLPVGYEERLVPEYFDDTFDVQRNIVFQPEIYPVAQMLLSGTARKRLVDVGCGIGIELAEAKAEAKLGIDFGANIAHCRDNYPGLAEWLAIDLAIEVPTQLVESIGPDDVVICSDVVEHLADPRPLLAFLSACFQRGALVITSTPERRLVRGADHLGPPPNPAHVREWAIAEYCSLLMASALPPLFMGLTFNNDQDRQLRTIISIHEPRLQLQYQASPRRPLAIMSCFNEDDVIAEAIEHWIAQGCDLHVLDNWSTDRTWSILSAASERLGRHLAIERFPSVEPSHGSWHDILTRKEDIAFCHKGRWIVHTDADEIRKSPFGGLNLADAMHLVELANWNRIDFTVLNYRPIDDSPFLPGTLTSAFRNFEFGTKPGHFVQKKAWLQGASKVRLADTGGHIAEFDDAHDCPYHFVLHHYPLRSVEHGRRKINRERADRWSADDLAVGWHGHYRELAGDANLVWDAKTLHDSTQDFWANHGLQILVGLKR
jgi:SAM-dependent methyltransferase